MEHLLAYLLAYYHSLESLFVEMSIYLLFGFGIAGLLSAYMKKERVGNALGKRSFGSVLKASLFGIPLPLCSCSVIPMGISLFKNGASKPATVSFLISTPQTGVDSLLVSYSLLGLPMAIVRAVVALVTGLFGGYTTALLDKGERMEFKEQMGKPAPKNKLLAALQFGFVDFVLDIAKWLIIGLLIAALLDVVLPEDFFTAYVSNSLVGMLLALLASIPLYICATGSVPIAATLMLKGLSPGAALVFLMAGPATNIASLTVFTNTLGKKTTMAYLFSIAFGAIVSGLIVDGLLPVEWFSLSNMSGHEHEIITPIFKELGAWVMLALLLNSLRIQYQNYRLNKTACSCEHDHSSTANHSESSFLKFQLSELSCQNCANKVKRELAVIQGFKSVKIDLEHNEIAVEGLNEEEVIQAVERTGYRCKRLN